MVSIPLSDLLASLGAALVIASLFYLVASMGEGPKPKP